MNSNVPTVVALILAGGYGSRLSPLTDARPKPAVPLAGSYRLIDVALSNLAHSGLRDVWVVEQYRPGLLNRHLAGGRPWDMDGTRRGLRIVPPEERDDDDRDGFSEGNGHALYQQLDALAEFGADTVVVLSADHLYQLDMRPVLAQHHERGSELTIITTEVLEDPSRYGVVSATPEGTVTGYEYKPADPSGNIVATEVFVYRVEALKRAITELLEGDSGANGADLGDYGDTIVPHLVEHGLVHEYRMTGYWRDLGTIDAYFQAHMELIDGGGIQLDRPDWPLLTNLSVSSPARIDAGATVTTSMICPGARIRGAVEHSLIGPGVTVERGATVSRSVLIGDVVVPTGAHLESVIADHGVTIPAGHIGKTKPGPGNITVIVDESSTDRGDALTP
ncbi:glucose-1-phosphate adenylyltransferase family protein [Corynebacterium comes]|uniref:Glucose-1-phosphate adenylyltransferase n=1 Tax=Corynebacterium comes TaxID=2675218 RepID=A0A6B8W6Q3_9CORY|nr:sugar phosphate nucleotidyltransferase [Corynebacterium comes]QGU05640.1 Glucose-1-phosphate adenylyltransferase [Corynebacterium comes]